MSNENKIEVKHGEHTVLLNPTITYEQDKNIQRVYLEEGTKRADTIEKANRVGIEYVVFSLDGNEKDIFERFKKLDLLTARIFIEKINQILDPKEPTPAVKAELGAGKI